MLFCFFLNDLHCVVEARITSPSTLRAGESGVVRDVGTGGADRIVESYGMARGVGWDDR